MRIIPTIVLLLITTTAPGDVKDPLDAKPHRVVNDHRRFHTDREGIDLDLPLEDDAFMFAVFGDRTGGPAAGISVLREAVADVNLIEPDFVMTVGDLIDGYNETPEWMRQMEEYTSSMDKLLMPWFPVAGNHDVYWRGDGERPAREHEQNYEMHFGPLWYAFDHKDSMFIVLYTDEGPESGPKRFNRPEAQRMSPEQFTWLESMLKRGRNAQHIFIFLHHPRWLEGGYGEDWRRVHALLAKAGNVRAVFAGHIHRMRYDGPRDGIEYITLATVGGGQSGAVPEAGYLHQYELVTVRDDQIALASYPVGAVMDVRAITGHISNETRKLADLEPQVSGPIRFAADRSVQDKVEVTITNPVFEKIDVAITFTSDDSRWRFVPDHAHFKLAPGESKTMTATIARGPGVVDSTYRAPEVHVGMDYLTSGRRYPIPEKVVVMEILPPEGQSPVADPDPAP
jgi:hypothetical protein